MTSGTGVIIIIVVMTTKHDIKIDADIAWDAGESSWVASAPDSSGKSASARANSPTRALNRLQLLLAKDYEKEVELTPKIHLPREVLGEFKEYQRKYKQFSELKGYVNDTRRGLGFRLVDQYRMPIATVAALFGLSSQRFGMMKQEFEMGNAGTSSARRSRKASDDGDE